MHCSQEDLIQGMRGGSTEENQLETILIKYYY